MTAAEQLLFINGSWRRSEGTFEVRSPWDGALLANVASATADDVRDAVQAAARHLASPLPADARAEILHRAHALLTDRREEFAETLVREAGKPIKAALGELDRALLTLRWSAEEAVRPPTETVPIDAVASGKGAWGFTIAEPVGVVAAITPFNFPVNLVLHKIAPAIAAGCPVVLKPSERTPLSAGLLVQLLADAGLPAGYLNLITGDPRMIVPTLTSSSEVSVVTFTGSSQVGWGLKAAAPRKQHVLELGSNTAMLVMPTAKVEQAVDAAVASGFGFSGQACVALQRLLVHEEAYDEVLAALVDKVRGLVVGAPEDANTDVGPVISAEAADRLEDWIKQAVSGGASLLTGGGRDGNLLEPTLIADVPDDSPLSCEEAFGPVAVVGRVRSLEEGIEKVNSSRFGLNSAIWTERLDEARLYASRVEAGTVLVNMPPAYRSDHMPYGGVKESGHGREGVRYTVESLTHQKLVILR